MRRNAVNTQFFLLFAFFPLFCRTAAADLKNAFLEQFPLGKNVIEWDQESGQTVRFGGGKPAVVTLKGRLVGAQSMEVDFLPVALDAERKFQLNLELWSEPRDFQMKIKSERGHISSATFTYAWKKTPPILNLKIREKRTNQVKSYEGSYPLEEWVSFSWKEFSLPEEKAEESEWMLAPWFDHFQLNAIAALPNTGGNSVSPQFSWNPLWSLGAGFTLSLNLAVSVFKYDATVRFPTTEFGPLLGVQLGWFWLEVGPSIHVWHGQGGVRPGGTSFVSIPFQSKWFGMIEKIFGGYSIDFLVDSKVHEAKLGVGISF